MCKKGDGFIAKGSWRQRKDPGMLAAFFFFKRDIIFGTKL